MNGYLSLKNLPLPTPVNRQWRTGSGGTYLSKEANDKRKAIVAEIHRILGSVESPISTACTISIVWTPRDKRLADVDAYIKGCLDAITKAGVWVDDSLVELVTCERLPIPKSPGHWDCEIHVIE
jgi:crossover junction endodeoxyribonuclease RusA